MATAYPSSDINLTLDTDNNNFKLKTFNDAFNEIQNHINGLRTHSLSKLTFTYVVDSDEALEAWVNNTSGNDYTSVLIKKGEYTFSGTGDGINLTTTGTKVIIGETGSKIIINKTNSGTGKAIYYDTLPTTDDYFVNNLTLEYNATSGRALLLLRNLTNCKISAYGNSSSVAITAAASCINVVRCSLNGFSTGAYGYGARDCINVQECDGYGEGTTIGTGFAHCNTLRYCTDRSSTPFYDSYSSSTDTDSRFLCADTLLGGYNSVVGQSTPATSIPADTIKTTPIDTDVSYQIPFVSGVTSEYKTLYTDNTNGHLAYNPSTNTLTTSYFNGNLGTTNGSFSYSTLYDKVKKLDTNGQINWSNVTNKPSALPSVLKSTKPLYNSYNSTWSSKTWNGFTYPDGTCIWTDGIDIYYSNGSNQYVLDKDTSTWSVKTWSGLTNFSGRLIWTDGIDIYYSNSNSQYVLDKSTSTWSVKTWNGFTSVSGNFIWTDGENIYYSLNTNTHYVLDKSTSTWSKKTWSGFTDFNGEDIWTDGTDIYFSYGSYSSPRQYILDKSTSTWSKKTWSGLTSFNGIFVWTDGTDIYYSYTSNQYVLNKSTSTWSTKTWRGLTNFSGNFIWTDGTDIYLSSNNQLNYVLNKKSLRAKTLFQ